MLYCEGKAHIGELQDLRRGCGVSRGKARTSVWGSWRERLERKMQAGSSLEYVSQNLITDLKESGGGACGARHRTEAFMKDLHPLP